MENKNENQLDELLFNIKDEYYGSYLSNKVYLVLSITALISNLIGAISNVVIFGLSITSIICIIFSVLVIIGNIVGLKIKNKKIILTILLCLIIYIEIPILFISYREAAIPYFILGIFAVPAILDDKFKIFALISLIIIDIISVVVSFAYPDIYNEFIDEGKMIYFYSSLFVSFVISTVAIVLSLYFLQNAYKKNYNEYLELNKKFDMVNHYDSLVPCYNRRYVSNYLESVSKSTSSIGISIIMADIRGIEDINDKNGYTAGDSTLVTFASIAFQFLKGRGFVSRFGGSKFLIVLNVTVEAEITRMMNDIITNFNKNKPEEIYLVYAVTICKNNFSLEDELRILNSQCKAKTKINKK